MPSLPNIPWTIPAALAAGAFLVVATGQTVRPILAARQRRERKSHDKFLWLLVVLGCSLAPVFFLDMFRTVTDLLNGSGFPESWTVPAATEGAFVFLYLLGLYLRRKGKPKLWLRWAPYPFAAASLFLNVYSAHGRIAPMVGHAAVTVAFFLPVLAAESAIDSMAFTSADMAFHRELADAMRYARDLLRDQKGILWYWRVPPLLRRQAMRGRPPADVKMAVAEGAEGAGASAWETPVDEWVTNGLTRRENLDAKVTRKRAEIRREAVTDPLTVTAHEVAPPAAHEDANEPAHRDGPEVAHEARTKPRTVSALKLTAARSRNMPPEELALHVGAMLNAYGEDAVSLARVRRDLHVGPDKARDALALALKARKGADVIKMAR